MKRVQTMLLTLGTLSLLSFAAGINDDLCRRGVKITSQSNMESLVDFKDVQLEYKEAPREVKIEAVRITVDSTYCPDAALHNPPGDCDQLNNKGFELTQSEFRESMRKNMCKIGRFCQPNICFGKLSSECKVMNRTEWTAPLKHPNYQYKDSFFRYTCGMRWECEIATYTASPTANSKGDGFSVYGLANEEIPLVSEFHFLKGVNYRVRPFYVRSGSKPFKCFGYGRENICMYSSNPEEYMIINKDGGRGRNVILGKPVNLPSPHEVMTESDKEHLMSLLYKADLTSKANIFSLLKDMRRIQSQMLCLIEKSNTCLDTLFDGPFSAVRVKGEDDFLVCPKLVVAQDTNRTNVINSNDPEQWDHESPPKLV
ncbi:Hypothetical protein NTJ_03193 [Nesidiocoris tenuis]|uniref:Uncharacterized protein n=1 Tax=Nesidiocoris tenuis TaxID=355587 RepID=A0ABN7ADP4_9HEMI|nr:Hypothetical protein NTJ_03193 [Nesidiocoris tenuis]